MDPSLKIPETETPGSDGVKQFLDQSSRPTQPSMDGGGASQHFVPPPAGNAPNPQEQVNENPEPDGPKIFQDDEEIQFGPDGDLKAATPNTDKPKYSEDYKKRMLSFYLDMEEEGTAFLAALFAGTTDYSRFKYSPKQKEYMLLALEPYRDIIVEKLPAWVPLVLVYGGLKFDQIKQAWTDYKTTQTNTAAKQDTTQLHKFSGKREARTNFLIYAPDGYYKNYPNGGYCPRDSKDKEKPSWNDIDEILKVNSVPVVLKAFDITIEELQAKGVNLNNNE